jgi:hypothetical protein
MQAGLQVVAGAQRVVQVGLLTGLSGFCRPPPAAPAGLATAPAPSRRVLGTILDQHSFLVRAGRPGSTNYGY